LVEFIFRLEFNLFLQYFDTVGWVLWPVKTVARITYTVLVETLNPAQSINRSLEFNLTQFLVTFLQIKTHGFENCLSDNQQESPAIADKPAWRESLPKLLQFDMPTTLSLTILAYLHAFNCCCVRNPRNLEKFTENSNLWSSRSSKVIDLGADRKPIC